MVAAVRSERHRIGVDREHDLAVRLTRALGESTNAAEQIHHWGHLSKSLLRILNLIKFLM